MCDLNDAGESAAPSIGEGQGHDGHRHDDAIGVAESKSEGKHRHHFHPLGSDELCETRLLLLLLLLVMVLSFLVVLTVVQLVLVRNRVEVSVV